MNRLQQLITSEQYRDHAAYWKGALDGIEREFRLTQNWSPDRAAVNQPVGWWFGLPDGASRFVTKVARDSELSAFTVVLAGVFHLLRVYTREDVIQIVSPRLADAEGEDGGGLVPLVWRCESGVTVREFLDRIGTVVSTSYTYQGFPVTEMAGAAAQSNVRIQCRGLHRRLEGAAGGLTITIERGATLRIGLEARLGEFDVAFVENFGRHLSNVLEGYQRLDSILDDVAVMDEAEQSRVTESVRGVPIPEGTVLDLFRRQAEASPSAVALVLPDGEFSYGELNELSGRLATFLRDDYGIRPGDAVGVLSDRSQRWIVGVLGILKAGGVYVPLDPEYPQERLTFMIEDSGVKALLVHSDYLGALTGMWSLPMFALDFQLDMLEAGNAPAPPRPSERDAAYLIYTSGSTGKPKGVLLEHRGLLNVVLHHIDAFGFDASDRVTQFYSPSFDGSLLEIFVTLGCGARLVMASPELIRDVPRYAAYLEEKGATTINAPPVYLRQLDWSRLGAVKRVISAGDSARSQDAQEIAAGRTFHNSYGPTEATVCATDYVVESGRRYGARIPIGKPLRNTQVYVLDANLKPVPEGCAGEICISGVGLAREYLHQPELTQAAFVAHPLHPGERLYRTGDLGVRRPDGNLEWLGREDGQVKIRGYRIETGEIEAVLRGREGVDDAAVVAQLEGGEKRLVAYVASAQKLAANELREFMAERLPSYMIPAAFVVVASLPLNPNGKIDRRALAAMPLEGAAQESYTPPQSAVEQRLAEVWAEVLGLPRVGVQDNFFEQGGDSIRILQAVSRTQRAGLRVTPQQMFEHQTVAALARVATPIGKIEAQQDAVTGAVPLTAIQRWFFSQPVVDRHHYNHSVLLEIPGDVRREWIEEALGRVVAHHDALRLRFRETNGEWVATHAEVPSEVRIGESSLAGLEAADRDAALQGEAAKVHASLNLAEGPLLRAHWFPLGGGVPGRLLIVAHHLVIDGVSWRVLLQDLHSALSRISEGAAVQLPAKTTSFQYWARRIAEFAPAEDAGSAYWAQLASKPVASIPTDHDSGASANLFGSAARITRRLDQSQTGRLLHEAPKAAGTQAQEILVAALAGALWDWSAAGAVCIGMESHGREDLFQETDLSRTVGWFTALYPLVIELTSSEPAELLSVVKEELRAVPLRGLGYGLSRYLRADSEMASLAAVLDRPEVLFNYIGQVDHAMEDGGWKLLPEPQGVERSPDCPRPHLFEVELMVHGGALTVNWIYSRNLHDAATIERLSARYMDVLANLIEHCCSTAADGRSSLTPLMARAQS